MNRDQVKIIVGHEKSIVLIELYNIPIKRISIMKLFMEKLIQRH